MTVGLSRPVNSCSLETSSAVPMMLFSTSCSSGGAAGAEASGGMLADACHHVAGTPAGMQAESPGQTRMQVKVRAPNTGQSTLGHPGPPTKHNPSLAPHLRVLVKLRLVGGIGLDVETDGGPRGAGAAQAEDDAGAVLRQQQEEEEQQRRQGSGARWRWGRPHVTSSVPACLLVRLAESGWETQAVGGWAQAHQPASQAAARQESAARTWMQAHHPPVLPPTHPPRQASGRSPPRTWKMKRMPWFLATLPSMGSVYVKLSAVSRE